MGSLSLSGEEAARMTSYVIETSSSSEVCSKHDDLFYNSFCMNESDKDRMDREFYNPDHIAITGNYWPRYRHTINTGSPYVSYLSRPYHNYNVPSGYKGQYGNSKYMKIQDVIWAETGHFTP